MDQSWDTAAGKASAPAQRGAAPAQLDLATAVAYGWPTDLPDEQILKNLFALNLKRAAEEVKAAQVKRPKGQRTKQADELV